MRRREIIKNIGLAGAGLTGAIATKKKAYSQINTTDRNPLIEWRMATSWPEDLEIVFGTSLEVCQKVEELTDGRFKIKAFPSGGIAPPLSILAEIQSGTVECGHTAGYYYVDKNPAFAFATTMPFGLSAYQQMSWIERGGGLELTRKIYADFNCVNMICCSAGVNIGGWFKKKVTKESDLKGLKMRIPGLGGEVMKRLGVEVKTLPPKEILPALETNAIDAAEWIGIVEEIKLGFNKVANYCYYPGWHEPGTTYEILINSDAWEKLPISYQNALKVATMDVHIRSMAKYDQANRMAYAKLLEEGTQFVPYSQEIMRAAYKATFELYEENATKNPSFKEIYTPWKQFRSEIFNWNKINELSLDSFVTS